MQPARFHLRGAAIALLSIVLPATAPKLAAQTPPRTLVMGGGYLLTGATVSSNNTLDFSSPNGRGDGGWGALGVQLPTDLSEKLDLRFDLGYALSRSVLSTTEVLGFSSQVSGLPSDFRAVESIYRLKFDRWKLAATGSFVWSPWQYFSMILGESVGLQHVYNISEEVEYSGFYWDGQMYYAGGPDASILLRRPTSLENETRLLLGTRIGITSMIPTGHGVRIAPEISLTSETLSPFSSRTWSGSEIRAGASLLFDADIDR